MASRTEMVVLCAATGMLLSLCPPRVAAQPRALARDDATLNGLVPDRGGSVAGSLIDRNGTEIAPPARVPNRGHPEAQVAGPAARALAAAPDGSIDRRELAWEIATRFEALQDCRVEVARRRQVPLGAVQADRLSLRWTILDTGQTAGATAVGTTAIDADVLDCVKKQMLGWTFSAPSGGPLAVERAFEFRAAPLPPLPDGGPAH